MVMLELPAALPAAGEDLNCVTTGGLSLTTVVLLAYTVGWAGVVYDVIVVFSIVIYQK